MTITVSEKVGVSSKGSAKGGSTPPGLGSGVFRGVLLAALPLGCTGTVVNMCGAARGNCCANPPEGCPAKYRAVADGCCRGAPAGRPTEPDWAAGSPLWAAAADLAGFPPGAAMEASTKRCAAASRSRRGSGVRLGSPSLPNAAQPHTPISSRVLSFFNRRSWGSPSARHIPS